MREMVARFMAVDAEYNRATYEAAHRIDALRYALQCHDIIQSKRLSFTGRWAFAIARFVGFLPLEVYAWLESCPGAFADEFGEGWQ